MSTADLVPSNETHKAIKICHGKEIVSPILVMLNEDFSSDTIIVKLTVYGFINEGVDQTKNTHWFQDLKNGCLVFGTEGTKTIFTHSLCMVNVPMEVIEDEQ